MTEDPNTAGWSDLDRAWAAVEADPEDDATRLRFYERFSDHELYLLLEREPVGDQMEPKLFEPEGGPMLLVFDSEERLADFTGGVAPWVALPGRVIVQQMTGQGLSLGLNLGAHPSAMILPPEALDWLAGTLAGGPLELEARPEEFLRPSAPEVLIAALDRKLALASGLALGAVLAGVRWSDGRHGHVLAFLGAKPQAEEALARAVREALVFSGLDAGEIDVIFPAEGSPVLPALSRVGLRFDLPEPAQASPAEPAAPAPPGMDPSKPPRIR